MIKFSQICVHRTQEIYPYPHGHMASFQACLVQGSGAEPGIFSAFENGGYLDKFRDQFNRKLMIVS